MRKFSAFAVVLAFACAAMLAVRSHAAPNASPAIAIGATVSDFTLPDLEGKQHSLASLKGAKGTVIIFISAQCPVSNAYNERMEKLAQEYQARGVNVIGINSNATESVEWVKSHAKEKGFTFTILKDKGNKIADMFGAEHTPEAYLIDANNKLLYHGAIDNAQNASMVQSNYLRDAINAMLDGKPVAKAEAKAFGCSIKRVAQ